MSALTVTVEPAAGAPAPPAAISAGPTAATSAEPTARSVASPVRVRRAPPLEPPFEDEFDPAWPVRLSSAGHTAVTGTPMAQPGRGPHSQRPVTPRPVRGPLAPSGRPQPTPGVIAAQRFVSVCVEILNGHRAVSHLRAVTAPSDLKHITDQLVSRTNRTYLGRPGRTVTTPQRVRLVGLRMCEPRDGAVEVAVVLGYGMQTWAMAVRMERTTDTWLCKLIQVI